MSLRVRLLRRVLLAVPTLLGITIVTFLMTRVAPGDPATARMDDAAARLTPHERARLHEWLGLDRPVVQQYAAWFGRAVRLDFGHSWTTGRPAMHHVFDRLRPTLALAAAALTAALLLAVPLGLLSAARAGSRFDRAVTLLTSAIYAAPNYATALILLSFFSVKLGWLPASGRRSLDHEAMSWPVQFADLARHALLIGLCLAYPWWAYLVRFTRGTALDALASPCVAAARARGLGPARLYGAHVLRQTLISLVTVLGLALPALISGAVVLEYVFSWPGLGGLFVDSLFARDYPVVMALTVITGLLVLLINLLVDVAYVLLDPRLADA